MKFLGVMIAIFMWLFIAVMFACVPAIPFWLGGYGLTGCYIWLFAGLPLGMMLSFLVLTALFTDHTKWSNNN
jgi:hypothetical protein